MRRFQQHTHASWHRAYTDKFDCPWCQTPHRPESTTPQNQNQHSRKHFAKSSDNGRTSRANATSTPVGRRIVHESSDVLIEDQAAGTPIESQTPDSAPDANDEETPGPESDSNYARYNMGRTAGHDGLNTASDPPRPPLPEQWTKEVEDREHGAAEWSPPPVEDWRSQLGTPGVSGILSDEKIGSPELNVRELEQS
ncbi:unnamed protein product [Penicillium nalgiovense]|uniref:Uncharacterized protein n=1 Tax=Penicillium nalgiovense TaxID=60175 RepID=A0A9W4HZM0_PENNA|nr:unnamed protein product [Penicillium nalgiovense]CAG7947964.1 unnamed protein product [Penicillium nalgiovense]CAG7950129.1 unnamed protein product [Penicillium nalgiovense]CAG7980575.1 unnamed protein product [Penicillium nalgiovense]CAG7988791.1 unnamed protein product [Penicillium nalgiovense]